MSSKFYGVTNMAFNDDKEKSKYLLTDASEVKPFTFPNSMDNMGRMYPVEEIQFTTD